MTGTSSNWQTFLNCNEYHCNQDVALSMIRWPGGAHPRDSEEHPITLRVFEKHRTTKRAVVLDCWYNGERQPRIRKIPTALCKMSREILRLSLHLMASNIGISRKVVGPDSISRRRSQRYGDSSSGVICSGRVCCKNWLAFTCATLLLFHLPN